MKIDADIDIDLDLNGGGAHAKNCAGVSFDEHIESGFDPKFMIHLRKGFSKNTEPSAQKSKLTYSISNFSTKMPFTVNK